MSTPSLQPRADDLTTVFLAALAAEQELGMIPHGATRPLFPWEVGTVDFAAMDGDHEVAYSDTARSLDALREKILDEMTAALSGDGDPLQVAAELRRFATTQTPKVQQAIEAAVTDIETSLYTAYGKAGSTVAADAAEQLGTSVARIAVGAEPGIFTEAAAVAPQWLFQRLTSAALQAGGPRQPPASETVAAAGRVDMAGAYDLSRQAVNVAYGEGRGNAVQQLPDVQEVYASELLDGNTCDPCAAIDGTRYDSNDAAEADYPGGAGYVDCDGGARCRGTLVYLWTMPGDDGTPPDILNQDGTPPPDDSTPTAPPEGEAVPAVGEPAAPAAPDLTGMSDEELETALGDAYAAEGPEAEALQESYAAELDARDAAKAEAQLQQQARDLKTATAKAKRDATREVQRELESARISDLIVNQGWEEADATAEVTGRAYAQVQRDIAIRQLRADGFTGRSFDALARQAFTRAVKEDRIASEDLLRGGHELNKAGQRAKRDPDKLWTGSEDYARKWASPELLEWWDLHGRRTYADFRDQLLTGRSRVDIKRGSWLA